MGSCTTPGMRNRRSAAWNGNAMVTFRTSISMWTSPPGAFHFPTKRPAGTCGSGPPISIRRSIANTISRKGVLLGNGPHQQEQNPQKAAKGKGHQPGFWSLQTACHFIKEPEGVRNDIPGIEPEEPSDINAIAAQKADQEKRQGSNPFIGPELYQTVHVHQRQQAQQQAVQGKDKDQEQVQPHQVGGIVVQVHQIGNDIRTVRKKQQPQYKAHGKPGSGQRSSFRTGDHDLADQKGDGGQKEVPGQKGIVERTGHPTAEQQ